MGNGVEFTLESENGEMGFPGNLTVKTVYQLTGDNELVMEWHATTDGDLRTPVNLCNHAYWNLSGDFAETTIANHKLQLHCNEFVELDS